MPHAESLFIQLTGKTHSVSYILLGQKQFRFGTSQTWSRLQPHSMPGHLAAGSIVLVAYASCTMACRRDEHTTIAAAEVCQPRIRADLCHRERWCRSHRTRLICHRSDQQLELRPVRPHEAGRGVAIHGNGGAKERLLAAGLCPQGASPVHVTIIGAPLCRCVRFGAPMKSPECFRHTWPPVGESTRAMPAPTAAAYM